MKNTLIAILFAGLVSGCSSLKTAKNRQNYDDAYFVSSDIDKSSVYGKTNPDLFKAPRATAQAETSRTTRSYGQSYSDRMRNFGSGSMQQNYIPPVYFSPRTACLMYSPYSYNPYFGMNNPYGYGYNPYYGSYYDPYYGYGYNNYYNPSWCYWNQYYSPYNNNYWGGGNNSNNSGGSWGGSKQTTTTSKNSFNNTGTRRNSYNTGLPASGQTTRTGYNSSSSSGSSSSSSSSSGSSGTYYRPSSSSSSSGSSGSSSGSYSRPSSSGSSGATNATGGGQSGSNTRRR